MHGYAEHGYPADGDCSVEAAGAIGREKDLRRRSIILLRKLADSEFHLLVRYPYFGRGSFGSGRG